MTCDPVTCTAPGSTRTANVSADDGHFTIDKVVPGKIQIIGVDGSGGMSREDADLAPGATLEGVRLVLKPAVALQSPSTPPGVD